MLSPLRPLSFTPSRIAFGGNGQVFRLEQQAKAQGRTVLTVALSQYGSEQDIPKLKGAEPGFVGYGQPCFIDDLVKAVKQAAGGAKPLVILDEVGKAHPSIIPSFEKRLGELAQSGELPADSFELIKLD